MYVLMCKYIIIVYLIIIFIKYGLFENSNMYPISVRISYIIS